MLGRDEVQNSARLPSTPNDVFRSYAQSMEEKASILPLNKSRLLIRISSPLVVMSKFLYIAAI